MHVNLHLTEDTNLRAEGYVAGGRLFAEVRWGFPDPARLGDGSLWGTPAMMRRLATLATHAATQAEEEAAWQARGASAAAEQGSRVA